MGTGGLNDYFNVLCDIEYALLDREYIFIPRNQYVKWPSEVMPLVKSYSRKDETAKISVKNFMEFLINETTRLKNEKHQALIREEAAIKICMSFVKGQSKMIDNMRNGMDVNIAAFKTIKKELELCDKTTEKH